jgi:glyoxylase-like metal-dependent hydrolase (beta-lactamase superfamily II)
VRDVTAVLLTHLHWDHAHCVSLFAHAELYMSAREAPSFLMRKTMNAHPRALRRVCGEQVLTVAGLDVRLVETPGHTPGSVAYVIDGRLLFTGDALRLKCGRALPAASWFGRNGEALKHSLHKLAGLAGIECLLTAHDGLSRDTHYAFARWVQAESALSERGVGS